MSNKNIFYVCSYGGSGSKMLCEALSKYGVAEHIHSRNPPDKLEYLGKQNGGNTYFEWFNGIPIPEDKLKNYYVLYIYRNPIFSIYSRLQNPNHLRHIQVDTNIKLKDVIETGKDLYKLKEFYNNYVKFKKKKNYKIYCVKYEDIFDKQDELSNLLQIGKLNIVNKSKKKYDKEKLEKLEKLKIIYADLIDEMNNNDFIRIV